MSTKPAKAAARTTKPPNKPKPIRVGKRVETARLNDLRPAQVNDVLYKPVDLGDPAIVEMARDVREKGLLEPIVVTTDDVIVSGHRRRAACLVADLEFVPVRRINIDSDDPRFEQYLIAFNRQRVKTAAEMIREEVARTSPEDAHNALLLHREDESWQARRRVHDAGLRVLRPGAARARSEITDAKRPMLDAVLGILEQYRGFWPLTLRQIHYRLLTRNVLRHAGKPDSRYANNQQSYKDLSNLLTRARLEGEVPWESMHDPTRPRTTWRQWDNVGAYMRKQFDGFLCGYRRNLLQSQPVYVELVVEKITAQDIAERAAREFQVPVGVGRGYTSVTSLEETAERFRDSNKDRFVLLIAGDLDPEGENIAETWVSSLRDEHDVDDITAVKVGVNPDQVERYGLAPLPVKESSVRAAGYKARHGDQVYELEAFEPDQLQAIIRDAISSVLDMDAFAQELREQAEEARTLVATRIHVCGMLKDLLRD